MAVLRGDEEIHYPIILFCAFSARDYASVMPNKGLFRCAAQGVYAQATPL